VRLFEVFAELGLDDWLRALDDGLDTTLGAGGRGLSAGEAQLIALARVFLKDPGLVVLDEASSRLDPKTERLLESAVTRLLAGRTGIVIAHRLTTVERADQILILEDGAVAECGARSVLADTPGHASHACCAQASGGAGMKPMRVLLSLVRAYPRDFTTCVLFATLVYFWLPIPPGWQRAFFDAPPVRPPSECGGRHRRAGRGATGRAGGPRSCKSRERGAAEESRLMRRNVFAGMCVVTASMVFRGRWRKPSAASATIRKSSPMGSTRCAT
jgi:hypothetical protein